MHDAKMLLPRDAAAPEERVDFVEVRQFPHTLLFDQGSHCKTKKKARERSLYQRFKSLP